MNRSSFARSALSRSIPLFDCPSLAIAKTLFELTKPRLALFSVLTAMAAYGASVEGTSLASILGALGAISLSAGGALSLNHWWERATDRHMRRTCFRPLPTGRIRPALALAWSAALSTSGIVWLLWQFNAAAATLALAIIIIYGLVYTPLKRRTRWATEIGSLSGALPPLLGGAAAERVDHPVPWTLFALLLLWQMPHFYAIGWRHRDDYRKAGFPLLPAIDPDGQRTAYWTLGYIIALLIVSIFPWIAGWLGPIYGSIATIAGLFLLRIAWRFHAQPNQRNQQARTLFLASIIYLPLIMGAMAIDAILW